ncbi:MAG: hypothetical protein PWQ91_67 [Eubacteriales bacterium]|nr:hypothetical protein [Eubacteriales bacterium]
MSEQWISKETLELIYEAAHIQRWNDHIRPAQGFTELDKQAHKMIIAYVLAKFEEEERKREVNWIELIEGGILEFFHRVVLTDIKPPIFYKLLEKHRDKLNKWVFDRLKERNAGFVIEKFNKYFNETDDRSLIKRILRAAHYLATNWEFKIIYRLNRDMYGIEETKRRIENELEEYFDLIGVQKISLGRKTSDFIDLVGQLRFQQRWTRTPRIPSTSVLGHMLVVAIISYYCSLKLGTCDKRRYNNFFAGLFHDLPEVLTRDIISPVKTSIEGLEGYIKDIETQEVKERLLPLLPPSWHDEFRYFMEEEFENKIKLNGRTTKIKEISDQFNQDQYSPLDGKLIKACDELAAFMEAYLSQKHGVRSEYLEDATINLPEKYKNKFINGLDFSRIYAFFKEK